MGYNAYSRLPALRNYAQAQRVLDTTKPIRGTNPPEIPLAERRYASKFSIRYKDQNPGGDIELLLYGQPTITFHAPDFNSANPELNKQKITLHTSLYWGSHHCHFIHEVLYVYVRNTRTDHGRLIIEPKYPQENQRFIVAAPKQDHTFMLDQDTGTMTPVTPDPSNPGQPIPLTTLRLNRKATNIVRARYGAFYRYVKGMIGVRKQSEEYKLPYSSDTETKTFVAFAAEEFLPMLPEGALVMDSTYGMSKYRVHAPEFVPLTYKPPALTAVSHYVKVEDQYGEERHVCKPTWTSEPRDRWEKATADFIKLITTPEEDPAQTENFYRAFVLLAANFIGKNNHGFIHPDKPLRVDPRALQAALDEVIFKIHSAEVVERVPARPGTVPGHKYEEWLDRDKD